MSLTTTLAAKAISFQTAMVRSLPGEITDKIIDLIDRHHCLHLGLVSRQWLHRCRTRYFTTFTIRKEFGWPGNGIPYETILSAHGTIIPHIGSLLVTARQIIPMTTWRALSVSAETGRFCLLHSLILYSTDLEKDRGALRLALLLCPQLRNLVLVSTKFDSVLDLAKMIAAAQSLENLKLVGILCVRSQPIPSSYDIPRTLKSLRLGVSDTNTNDITPWFQAQAARLHINTLELLRVDVIYAAALSKHSEFLALLGQQLEHLIIDISPGNLFIDC